ncbi:TetR/AcrR family transcriptional regulator [Mariniluteicoccus flavus]
MRGVREHIRSGGTSDLSVRQLAAAAGRSTMCVYTAFGGRAKLLAGVHDRVADEFISHLRGPVTCQKIAERYVAYAAAEPHLFELLGATTEDDQGVRLHARLLGRVLDLWGQCPGGDADHARRSWALTHGTLTGAWMEGAALAYAPSLRVGLESLCSQR